VDLLSDGGVHSHIVYHFALLKFAKDEGIKEVYVYCFLYCRYVGPKTAIGYIEQTEAEMKSLGIGKFASISVRYYAMDRDKRWERVQLAYDAVNDGVGPKFKQPTSVVEAAYEKETYDEFVETYVIVDKNNQPVSTIKDNEAMIFINFKPEKA